MIADSRPLELELELELELALESELGSDKLDLLSDDILTVELKKGLMIGKVGVDHIILCWEE